MPAPRPKILTAFTVPTGGWVLKVYVTNAGDYDTAVTATIPAGTYYVAGDNQADDFLYQLMSVTHAALDACAVAAYNGSGFEGKLLAGIVDAYVVLAVGDDLDMRVAWTEEDGADIAEVLGFSSAAVLDIEETIETGDWPHAYGWYADEDGQVEAHDLEDAVEALSLQSVAPTGNVRTIALSRKYSNRLALRFLTAAQMFSRAGYTEVPATPYTRNRGLECWWQAARQGAQFRVYLYNQRTYAGAVERGTATAGAPTTLTDGTKHWDIDPQQHAGKCIVRAAVADVADKLSMRWHIASHTATILTVPLAVAGVDVAAVGSEYGILDMRYRTYVLDISREPRFAPVEAADIERWSIEIPLLRYIA